MLVFAVDVDDCEEIRSLNESGSLCFKISFTESTLGLRSRSIPNLISDGGLINGVFSVKVIGIRGRCLRRECSSLEPPLDEDDEEVVVPEENEDGEQMNDFGDGMRTEVDAEEGEEAVELGEQRGPPPIGGGSRGSSSFQDLS